MILPRLALGRRRFLAAAAAALVLPRPSFAAARKIMRLELTAASPDDGFSGIFRAMELPRLVCGDIVAMTVRNGLRVPAAIGWRGLDGSPELQPWLGQPPIAAGATVVFTASLKQAGTLLGEARGQNGDLLAATPLIVAESVDQTADIDATLLIETRRNSAKADAATYLVNQRQAPFELQAPANARLRLRLLNATRGPFAVQSPGLMPVVMALDSQPCEPFQARDARMVLAPGTRIDLLLDAVGAAGKTFPFVLDDGTQKFPVATLTMSGGAPTRADALSAPLALPSNGLPERLALSTALRVDLTLDTERGWVTPQGLSPSAAPSFRVKRGRTVVLALGNSTDRASVFHLNGHHARLLDKLDDGWKPYWLDTLAVPARQTVRLAFAAEHVGDHLLECRALAADASSRLQTYRVLA